MDGLVLGIGIGVTKTAVGVVDADGRVLAEAVAATPAQAGADAVLANAADLAAAVRATVDRPVLAVGVGAPGVVDVRRGVVASATDLLAGWAGAAALARTQIEGNNIQ